MFLPPLPLALHFLTPQGHQRDGKGTKINPRWWFYCLRSSSQLSSSSLKASRSSGSILQLSTAGVARREVQGPYPALVPGTPFCILVCQWGWHPPPPDPNHSPHPAPAPPAARAWHWAGKWGEKQGGDWHRLTAGFWESCGRAVVWDVLKYSKLNTSLKLSLLLTVKTRGYVVWTFLNTWFVFQDLCSCFRGVWGFC